MYKKYWYPSTDVTPEDLCEHWCRTVWDTVAAKVVYVLGSHAVLKLWASALSLVFENQNFGNKKALNNYAKN